MAKKEPSKISHTFLSWRTLIYSIVTISSWKLVAGDKMQTKTNHHSACSLHCIHFYKIHWTWKKFREIASSGGIGLLKIEVIENENNDIDKVHHSGQKDIGPHSLPQKIHGVWKLQKKSHSTLQTKRATLTFWMDKSSLKMPKMVNLASFWPRVSASARERSRSYKWQLLLLLLGWFCIE